MVLWKSSGVFRGVPGMFRPRSKFYRHPKIRVANFEIHTTRIFAVKIRVANFEMHTTQIFAVKIRVANFEMHTTRIFAVKIRVAHFEIEQLGFLQ